VRTHTMKLIAPVVLAGLASAAKSAYNDMSNFQNGECKTSVRQSPIDIDTSSVIERPARYDDLHVHAFFKEVIAGKTFDTKLNDVLNKDGKTHDIKYTFEKEPGNKDFKCAQWHYHFLDSEHAIDGKLSVGEQHLVCYRAKYGNIGAAVGSKNSDALVVFGARVRVDENAADNTHWDTKHEIFRNYTEANKDQVLNLEIPMPENLMSSNYYRYMGGLTAGGCNEIVQWTLFKNDIVISKKQGDLIKAMQKNGVVAGNNRHTQPLNGRTVFEFVAGDMSGSDGKSDGGLKTNTFQYTADGVKYCASHSSYGIKQKLTWKKCGTENEGFELEECKKEKGWYYIKSTGKKDDMGRCFSIVNPSRAFKAPVVLKRCKGDVRQKFKFSKGMLWLHTTGSDKQRYCVPFMGAGSMLRSRRCYGPQF